ncbi:hypothetical protein CBR_g25895 [Chara braunii]|uniref:Uncharacterized protein n=1 Tax=Chara braunii TaxID=69332 RepID=A0A388L6Q7_CHABU|nr:hypothetical protein CBR_g25895 [Chara braunii]|eukprot:GBG77964.1 hypothetical protein CBR_g25895 [Chara braunii]
MVSGGKGSGRKGSGGKGSRGKHRAYTTRERRGTESHFDGRRDSDMRDETAMVSCQVRVHLHLSARTLFPEDEERGEVGIHSQFLRSATSAPNATVLRGKEMGRFGSPRLELDTVFPCSPPFSPAQTRDCPSSKVPEGPAVGVLETGDSEYAWSASEGASSNLRGKSTADPGEDGLPQEAHAMRREEETPHWPPRRVVDGLNAGVLETEASDHPSRPLEGASVDLESKSTTRPGEGKLSQEAHAVHREEETQHWSPNKVQEGLGAGVVETNDGERQCHASEAGEASGEKRSNAGESDGSGGKGSGEEGSGGKGSGGTGSHCEGSPASDTQGDAALRSYQVRVDSHLSSRTLCRDVEDNTLLLHLLEEGERLQSTMTSVEGPAAGVLKTGASGCEGRASEETHAVQRGEELLQGSSASTFSIRDTDVVLHTRAPQTTQEGGVEGCQRTSVEGKERED